MNYKNQEEMILVPTIHLTMVRTYALVINLLTDANCKTISFKKSRNDS